MYAIGTDYQCNSPAILQLRSRCIEKPINTFELLEIANEKQTEVYEKQKQRDKRGDDGEENDLEIVLLKNVSLRSYMDWIKESHHGIRPSFIPNNKENLPIGDIVITEVPCGAHEVASGELMKAVVLELSHISRNLEDTIVLEPAKDIKWTNGKVKIPDGGLTTLDSPLPNVVIEVAYSESFRQLQANVHNWIQFTNHVQISIGIKIFTMNTQQQRKMIVLYEDRQGMTQEIEFGIQLAPQPLQIPIAILYREIPQELQDIAFLKIQLIPLRNKILRKL
jgi:hypothetical protein